ncbi:hypothetical protein GCM10027074_70480 [Streptomyces deserti]
MKCFWLSALCVIASSWPCSRRTSSATKTWQAVGWSVMLLSTVGLIGILVRIEGQTRAIGRRARD